MINADGNNDWVAEPKPAEEGRRVVLLAGGGPLFPALALALASRGESIALWETEAVTDRQEAESAWDPSAVEMNISECHIPHAGPAAMPPSILDLQLAIERAGGISLRVNGDELGVAAEAFGRIDTAVALTRNAARRILTATGPLERRLRPARLVMPQAGSATAMASPLPGVLNTESAQAALGLEIPPGIRIYMMDLSAGLETLDGAAVLAGILESK